MANIQPVHQTVPELTAQNVKAVFELERQVRRARSLPDRIVDGVTTFCGSLPFVYLHLVWFALWIGSDIVFEHRVVDPFPYELLTLIVSLEAILLSSIILISQNKDAKISERRNHLALQIELLSEEESTKMLRMLARISKRLGIECDEDPRTAVLEQATDPEHLARQIDSELAEKDEGSIG